MTPDHQSEPRIAGGPALSAAARRRRDDMLPALIESLHRHHRRRRNLRRAGVGLLLAIVATIGATALRPSTPAVPRVAESPVEIPATPFIQRVATSPNARERFIRPAPRLIQRITDDELVVRLAAAGSPGALIRRDGKAFVVFDGT